MMRMVLLARLSAPGMGGSPGFADVSIKFTNLTNVTSLITKAMLYAS